MWILRCLLDHFHSIVRGFEPSAICRIWLKGQTTRKLWKKDCAFGDAIGHCRWWHHPGNIHLHFWTFWITPLFHQSLRTRNSGCYQWSPTGLTYVYIYMCIFIYLFMYLSIYMSYTYIYVYIVDLFIFLFLNLCSIIVLPEIARHSPRGCSAVWHLVPPQNQVREISGGSTKMESIGTRHLTL